MLLIGTLDTGVILVRDHRPDDLRYAVQQKRIKDMFRTGRICNFSFGEWFF